MEPPLEKWIGQHPDSYPPIVIIICDGWATDGEPQQEAQRIRGLRTSDGNVLLFTIHLSNNDKSRPTLFPKQEEGLLSLGEGQDDSKMMFRMTSVQPEGGGQFGLCRGRRFPRAYPERRRGGLGSVLGHRHPRPLQPALIRGAGLRKY